MNKKKNDQQIIDELRRENTELRAQNAAKDAEISELQAKNEQYLERIFSIAENKSFQSTQQIPHQILYQPPMPPVTVNKTDKIFNFMNDKCIPISLDEFENMGSKATHEDLQVFIRDGLVEGCSKLIIKTLNNIPIENRPFHAVTKKRVTEFYMKPDNKWIVDKEIFEKTINKFRANVRNRCIHMRDEYVGESYEELDDETGELKKRYSAAQVALQDEFMMIQMRVQSCDEDKLSKIIKKISNSIELTESMT